MNLVNDSAALAVKDLPLLSMGWAKQGHQEKEEVCLDA